jgi:PAS domain S-box-containing protein
MTTKPSYEELKKRVAALEAQVKSFAEEQREFKRTVNFLESLLKSIPNPVFWKDTDGRYQGCNPAFTEIMGVNSEQIRGKTVYELWPSEQASVYHQKDLELLKNPKQQTYEFEVKDKEGKRRPVVYYKNVFLDDNGAVFGLVGSFIDISDIRQAQEEIIRRRKFLESVLYHAPEAIITLDEHQIVMDWNPGAEKMFGYKPEEAIGVQLDELVARNQHHTETTSKAPHIPSGQRVETFETVRYRKDGSPVHVMAAGSPILVEGALKGVVTVYTDISERVRNEKAYRETFEIIAKSPVVAFLWRNETDWPVEFVTANVEHIFGYSDEDFLSGRVLYSQIVHPDDLDRVASEVATYSQEPNRIEFTHEPYRIVAQDGDIHWINDSTFIRRDGTGTITHYQGIVTNITDRIRAEEGLRESEHFLNQVFEAIQDGISVLDADLNIIKTNKWMELMYASRKPLVGRKCFRVYQDRDSPCRWCPTLKTIESGKVHTEIVPYPSSNNPTGWIELSAFPIKNDRGNVVRVIEYVKDISARRRAEIDAIRVAQEWQTTFDSSNDAIWILDKDQNILRTNKAAERYFKYAEREMIGKHCWEIVHGTQKPIPECPILRTRKSLYRETMELKIGERWFEIAVDPILNDLGQFDGAVHVVSDITKQKQIIESLRESEEKFRTLVEQSPLGITLIDKKGVYQYLNPEFQHIFGYTIDDIPTGAVWFKKAFPEEKHRKEVIETWLNDLQETGIGQSRPRIYNTICKDGSKKTIQYRQVTLDNLDQFVIYEDITEKAILEQQLQQAQKMEAIGSLAGGIAHDFNNILGAILGRAEILMMDMKPENPHRVDLQEIHKAALRSSDLTRQLLSFARKQPIAPKVLKLNETVESSLKMLRSLIGEEIDLIWQPDTNLWLVKMDPVQIDQILTNLCVNARDAISGAGKITIESKNVVLDQSYCTIHSGFKPGNYVMLSVSDDGCGMDKKTLDNAFNPFFTTKKIGAGTGLGLSTVYGIVKQNEGFINVCSEPDIGATFKIYLPQVREPISASGEVSVTAIPEGAETVLVVEDDISILDLSRSLLERFGYKVLSAQKPFQALDMIDGYKGNIHLLLTDVVMPEMNGKELKERIEKRHPDIKVLFMSGYTANVIMHRGVIESNVHFIQKPFSIESLAKMVRKVLDEAKV